MSLEEQSQPSEQPKKNVLITPVSELISEPQKEGLSESTKETGRWILAMGGGQLSAILLSLIPYFPEVYAIHLPNDPNTTLVTLQIRAIVAFVIALSIRALDKYQHVKNQEKTGATGKSMGLFPF